MAKTVGKTGEIFCAYPEEPDLPNDQLAALHTFKENTIGAYVAAVGAQVPERVVIALLLFFAAKLNDDVNGQGKSKKAEVAKRLFRDAKENKNLNVTYKKLP
jgi:hypothetical protein